MNFKRYLTPEERLGCWQAGFLRKMASVGKKPSDLGFTKEANWLNSTLKGVGVASDLAKDAVLATLGLGLISGLPIGMVLHVADKSLRRDSKKTKELKAQRDAYRDAVARLRNSLQAEGAFA